MQVVWAINEMRRLRKGFQQTASSQTLGLVPTMGALHEGHLSLVRAAKVGCDKVAVSIFVNPMQFGPAEDFAQYPRTFEQDVELLEREGVDLVFAPTAQEMYPQGEQAWVDVPGIGDRLDGASRPGHFRAVATVVAKLFNIVQPDKAFFGQKDAAQVAVLQTMVRSLNFDVELVVCKTVRDKDGLALSSRNQFLTRHDRREALALVQSLRRVKEAIVEGEHSAPLLKAMLLEELQATGNFRLDYAEIADPKTLERMSNFSEGALVAVAAWVGNTRLIDNVLIAPRQEQGR
jgi:pantoate--beta-alanine ligase